MSEVAWFIIAKPTTTLREGTPAAGLNSQPNSQFKKNNMISVPPPSDDVEYCDETDLVQRSQLLEW